MPENTYATKTKHLVRIINKLLQKGIKLHSQFSQKTLKTTITFQLVQFFGVINVIKILEVAYSKISGSLSPRHGASPGCGWRNGLQYGGKLRIHSISSLEQPARGGPSALGLGEVRTTPHRKTWSSCEMDKFAPGLD